MNIINCFELKVETYKSEAVKIYLESKENCESLLKLLDERT